MYRKNKNLSLPDTAVQIDLVQGEKKSNKRSTFSLQHDISEVRLEEGEALIFFSHFIMHTTVIQCGLSICPRINKLICHVGNKSFNLLLYQ